MVYTGKAARQEAYRAFNNDMVDLYNMKIPAPCKNVAAEVCNVLNRNHVIAQCDNCGGFYLVEDGSGHVNDDGLEMLICIACAAQRTRGGRL